MSDVQKITPFLRFDDDAEEAIAHDQSIFGGGRVDVTRNGSARPRGAGDVPRHARFAAMTTIGIAALEPAVAG